MGEQYKATHRTQSVTVKDGAAKGFYQLFRPYLRSWEDTHARWTQKCKGVQQEKHTIQVTGGLVADASDVARRPAVVNPSVSDVRAPGPAGLAPAAAERLQQIEDRAKRCEETLRRIERVLSKLRVAAVTGEWSSDTMRTSIKKEPKWISGTVDSVVRGQRMTVLDVKGDWWHVRRLPGKEGWVHRKEVEEWLPTELSTEPDDGQKIRGDKDWRTGGNQAGRG
jgi:uncharacterized protein YgiM (DUF1202 family)